MPTPIQDEIAHSILLKEQRKARAKAVLNHPSSSVPTLLVTMLIVGLGSYLQGAYQFEAPMWVSVFLMVGVSGSVANMMDLWTTRRRLEAAIILLQQQQDSQH
ncbi:hypothetical protein GTP38_08805 [Duganella sp. FT94W]|uniref:Uncharacterized protein n=1 Tax=Duganella lactea TaxID=2692173 RepID=A0ABW9V6S1_9BURK|nr:hypothetical protein [Duganella lactea]MYM34434.1 hypothetical protein [Duganella lactea]